MKLIFAGTPEFAAEALAALLAAGHDIALVLTQPDRPAGRGMALQASPVKRLALQHGLTVLQPPTLKDAALQADLAALAADVMVVAAYGLILPPAVLALPTYGCLNIHASLLPRWRGAAPIARALLAGDDVSGISIMQMDAGLDTGPLLDSAALPIAADETAASLHDRLATLGARLIVATLDRLPQPAQPQASDGATYAAKIDKAESVIDWRAAASQIDRQVRAFNPVPGARTCLDASQGGAALKIWRAAPIADLPQRGAPGEILAAGAAGIVVACGSGALRIDELQKAGGKRLAAAQFLAGNPLAPGAMLGGA